MTDHLSTVLVGESAAWSALAVAGEHAKANPVVERRSRSADRDGGRGAAGAAHPSLPPSGGVRGLTTRQLVKRHGRLFVDVEWLLSDLAKDGLIEHVDGLWRLTPHAEQRFGIVRNVSPPNEILEGM